MNRPYILLDENDFVIPAIFAEECPPNGIEELLTENFIKAKFDRVNRVFFEGATNDEIREVKRVKISEIDNYYTAKISELVDKHVQKKTITGVPIPESVLLQYESLKTECNMRIKEIDPDQEMSKPTTKTSK